MREAAECTGIPGKRTRARTEPKKWRQDSRPGTVFKRKEKKDHRRMEAVTMARLENTSLHTATSGNVSQGGVISTISQTYTRSLTLTLLALTICLFGMLGNIVVFRFLFFKIQQNQSSVYILNLAFADFTFLVGCAIILVFCLCVLQRVQASNQEKVIVTVIGSLLYNLGFNASNCILTAVSIERCLAVLFPIWNRCHRPKQQSTCVCFLLWAFSGLVTGLECFVCPGAGKYREPGSERCTAVYFFSSALYLLLVLLMVLSCLVLLIEIRQNSQQRQPPKLYLVILLTVLVFLVSVVPARVIGLLLYFKVLPKEGFLVAFFFITATCSSVNCSANPYIYMFVGKWKMRKCKGSIKQALENIFKGDYEISHSTISNMNTSQNSLS
ncbi:mas-related G-protein coupled receptor member H-like [Ambystoma mexicanum]|uniref:mas-related G-protein coupled receptor member H-like n=1 Tax=Ambystoma mexicanum TaxID=8296 RepID=UPI0037E7FDFE